ncbi:MAG: membrane protein insertase YidC [Verrucomicrobiaceae bacterium]|nr:MAG: membrane protein insertase YidC [Verrucomicrobiaceae bacterium]RPJ35296.1 MAG: membrane protein insertase YidC [Verrucomicrobiaceae bacterium]
MYDRKTWAVLVICGGLLAANLYYSAQNQRAQAEAKQRELALSETKAAIEEKPAVATTAELTVETPPPPTEEELVVLKNDKVAFTLTNIGGGIKHAEFQNEFDVGSRTSRVTANRFGPGPIGAIAGADETLDNTPYAYKAEESIEGKKAVYIAKLASGLIAKKAFTLNEGSEPGAPYLLDFDLQIENATTAALNLSQSSVFMGEASPLYQAEWPQQTGFFWRADGRVHFTAGSSFKGGWFSAAKSVVNSPEETVEFAGVTNQFFATVLRPREPMITSMWARSSQVTLPDGPKPHTSVRAGLRLPSGELKPAEIKSFQYRIFIGPKHNNLLRRMDRYWGEGWGDVMQYGWFWFVSRPLNFLLNTYHSWLDGIARNWSWGLAIIFLTITVRILIWPLHAKSTHTMKRMAKLKPEMDKLKEKYPDDPNKLNTEMMGLYRKFGINPLGGCLPMFLQIPIFFGFYRMLQYAVELRGQGFLWVNDLSQPDTLAHVAGVPINLLPVVMAITSFLQIKMTPMTGDKMQQRIIMFMPFMFFFFCYNFASALALYWTTQNIFSIGQTWLMSKVPEPELKPVKGAGKSWVQRMAERQAEMQKLQKERQAGGIRDVTPDKKKRPPRTGG